MIFNARQIASAITVSLFVVSAQQSAQGQSIFDRLGGQVKQQLQQEIQRAVPGLTPPQQRPPAVGTSSGIPGEGGQQNNNGGFDPNGFFRPSPGGGNPGGGRPGGGNPIISRPGGGSQTVPYIPPSNSYPQTSPPATITYSEPPVASGDFNGGTIKVRCPKNATQAVTYKLVLGGKSFPYTMRPGESQSFSENRLWLIRYISGSSEVTYRLRGGNVYSFDTSKGRTELFRDPEDYQEFPEPPTRDGQ